MRGVIASFDFQTKKCFNKNTSLTQLQFSLDKSNQRVATLIYQRPWRTSPGRRAEEKEHVTTDQPFLQSTVAAVLATMCFVLATDTLGPQLTAMCTPLFSPCNFLMITSEAFSTQGSSTHVGALFECCGQVQEKLKGGRARSCLISLAVHTKVTRHHCGWVQLADPQMCF